MTGWIINHNRPAVGQRNRHPPDVRARPIADITDGFWTSVGAAGISRYRENRSAPSTRRRGCVAPSPLTYLRAWLRYRFSSCSGPKSIGRGSLMGARRKSSSNRSRSAQAAGAIVVPWLSAARCIFAQTFHAPFRAPARSGQKHAANGLDTSHRTGFSSSSDRRIRV